MFHFIVHKLPSYCSMALDPPTMMQLLRFKNLAQNGDSKDAVAISAPEFQKYQLINSKPSIFMT